MLEGQHDGQDQSSFVVVAVVAVQSSKWAKDLATVHCSERLRRVEGSDTDIATVFAILYLFIANGR